eukprot:superscaffoldBa00001222_g9577
MPKGSYTSMAFATAFIVLSISAIAGLITMIILYTNQIAEMHPTPPPTLLSTTEAPPPVMRLPKNLIPESYEVHIKPHLYPKIMEEVNVTSPNQTMLFTGNSTVHFHCVQKTGSIYLHSKNLAVSSPVVKIKKSDQKVSVFRMKHHEDGSDFLEIQLNNALEAGYNYSLSLTFEGEISENLEGLYVSTYNDGVPAYEDQIALPDLNPAAMENWGLVTYQEGGLLYEENVSSLLHKEVIATLIAHELAHQKDTFILSDLHTAFEEDALASSHPLSAPQEDVQTTYEIIEMFDAITYSKGAIVLRMLADVVGEEVFNNGVKLTLLTVQRLFMDPDYTLFYFFYLFSLWWEVPIRVMSEPDLVWLRDNKTVEIEDLRSKNGEWILVNVNCTGYYRVNYDPENWERLLTQLETDTDPIPPINRGQLIDDAFNLARAKLVNVTLALNSTRFLRNETAYLPWESAVRNLKYFILMFDRSEICFFLQAYLQQQVKGLYNFFKNDTDKSEVPSDHSLQHSQITAIEVACSNGLPECQEMAKKMYADWMESNNTNKIHPNLRSVIYCQAVAEGGMKEWEFAWEKFQSSSKTSEKDQLREALSCTRKIWLLNRYLQYTLNPEKIRLMDVASTINYIARNVVGQELTWNFIRANWDYVSQGDGAMLIEAVTRRFSTQFELEELERFATTYEMGPATTAVYQAIEQTQVNIQWVSENKETILKWFESETAS